METTGNIDQERQVNGAGADADAGNTDAMFTLDGKPIPHIHTWRLILRPLEAKDDRDMHAMRGREDAMKFSSTGKPDPDLNYTRGRIKNFNAPDALAFAVLEANEPSRVIGQVGFISTPGSDTFDIGYGIHPDFWGKGYASEAVPVAIEAWWKFSEEVPCCEAESEEEKEKKEKMDRLFAFTAKENVASNAIMRRCGFQVVQEFADELGRDSMQWKLERPVRA